MADLLQKVFTIYVRPFYLDAEDNKVYYKGATYAQIAGIEKLLKTTNLAGETNSPVKLNAEGAYTADPWFLFGAYTSYGRFTEVLKSVVADYGTDNVKCGIYTPIDYQVLPIE